MGEAEEEGRGGCGAARVEGKGGRRGLQVMVTRGWCRLGEQVGAESASTRLAWCVQSTRALVLCG